MLPGGEDAGRGCGATRAGEDHSEERLERGRSLLRARLVRRGLGPAAVLVAAAWPSATASACLPATLVSSTTKAAGPFAAGQAAAPGVISVKVAALTEGVMNTMLPTKLKFVTVMLLVIASVCSVCGFIRPRDNPQKRKSSGS